MRREWLAKLAEGPHSCHSWRPQNCYWLYPGCRWLTWGKSSTYYFIEFGAVSYSCKRCSSGQCLRSSPNSFSPACPYFPFCIMIYVLFLLIIFLCFPFVVPCHFSSSPHAWSSPTFLLTHWISLAEVESFILSFFGRRLSRQLIC